MLELVVVVVGKDLVLDLILVRADPEDLLDQGDGAGIGGQKSDTVHTLSRSSGGVYHAGAEKAIWNCILRCVCNAMQCVTGAAEVPLEG